MILEQTGGHTVADLSFEVSSNRCATVTIHSMRPGPGKAPVTLVEGFDGNALLNLERRKPGTRGRTTAVVGAGVGLLTRRPDLLLGFNSKREREQFERKFGTFDRHSQAAVCVFRDSEGERLLCGDTFNGSLQYGSLYAGAVSELAELLLVSKLEGNLRFDDLERIIPQLGGAFEPFQDLYNRTVEQEWRAIYPGVPTKGISSCGNPPVRIEPFTPKMTDTLILPDGTVVEALLTAEADNAAFNVVFPAWLETEFPLGLQDSECHDGIELNRFPSLVLDLHGHERPWKAVLVHLNPLKGTLLERSGGMEITHECPTVTGKLEWLLHCCRFDLRPHRFYGD